MIYLITLVVAFCSIVYELLMAQTLSALMGNAVLRYSITIGVYLASLGAGAMLCEKSGEQESVNRLIRIELWLSIIGGLAVIFIWSLDVFHRLFGSTQPFFAQGFGSHILPILFFVLCNMVIVSIGILSGFEIPLLIALSEARKPNSMNVVLGVDYFGSLIGAVLFPVLLLPRLGLFVTSYLTALLNACACVLLLIFKPASRKGYYSSVTGMIAAGLVLLFVASENTAEFFLKKFYYYDEVTSISSFFDSFSDHPKIEEFRSPYQNIHIVETPDSYDERLVYSQYSNKFMKEPGFPRDKWLFLNHKYQFASNTEEHYHEFFTHAPIQWASPPANVLVLGAGDGIIVRELLKYKEVKHIKLVDIDYKMLHIAKYHPVLKKVNHASFNDPRVTLIINDAFSWLQRCNQKFDAIYIDFPDPTTYDLAKLYSLEFYSLVRQCVSVNGFVAADIPRPYGNDDLWDIYFSTFYAAGFGTIKPFYNLVENVNDGILKVEKQFLDRNMVRWKNGYDNQGLTEKVDAFHRRFIEFVADTMGSLQHRFIFLKRNNAAVGTRFKDYGIPLYVFNEFRFFYAATMGFDNTFKPEKVNSIFRPTLPPFEFFNVNYPY